MHVVVCGVSAEKVVLPVSNVVDVCRVVEWTSDITACRPWLKSVIGKLIDVFSQSVAMSMSSRFHCKGKEWCYCSVSVLLALCDQIRCTAVKIMTYLRRVLDFYDVQSGCGTGTTFIDGYLCGCSGREPQCALQAVTMLKAVVENLGVLFRQ
jgi:hypothetical protein